MGSITFRYPSEDMVATMAIRSIPKITSEYNPNINGGRIQPVCA